MNGNEVHVFEISKSILVAAELPLNRLATECDVSRETNSRYTRQKVETLLDTFHEYICPADSMCVYAQVGMHNERYLSLLERPAAIGFHTKAFILFSPSFSHTHMLKLTHSLHFSVECFCWKLNG